MASVLFEAGQLTLPLLRKIVVATHPFRLSKKSINKIKQSADALSRLIKSGQTIYGVNTGFGSLANVPIPASELTELQRYLLLSHAAGVGEPLSDDIVRLILVLKINSLACGYSGVRSTLIDALIQLYHKEIYPLIPGQGSVGASGDLAPLAHLSMVLLGAGRVRYKGKCFSAKKGLKKAGLQPFNLMPKEGLALINGTQVSTAIALKALFEIEKLLMTGLVCGALSTEAVLGSEAPYDFRIHHVRGHTAQIKVAEILARLLRGSGIRKANKNKRRVQDPYSIRCQPQVMGACLMQWEYAASILLTEANAVSDNPLIFFEEDCVLSGGNFHAEPVAFAADALALVVAEIGALSERRIALLTDAHHSGLPAFLMTHSGLHSGFMPAHVTAAALASENKCLAHPTSVDSIPTSANQEDHVSMATYGARRLLSMIENTAHILAIELLTACQGIDFHAPLKPSKPLQKVMQQVRQEVSFRKKDRYFAPEIALAKKWIMNGEFCLSVL